MSTAEPPSPHARVLVAGVGNELLGDDGFGVEVARRLASRAPVAGVRVLDLGIKSFDLGFALLDGYEAAILVDATARGGAPGSLYVLEPATRAGAAAGAAVDGHAVGVAGALAWARANGDAVAVVRVVACEPLALFDDGAPTRGLSPAVAAAVEPACALVDELCRAALRGELHA